MTFVRKAALAIVFGSSVVLPLDAQPREDYAQIFSGDYQKAVQFLDREKWMEDTIRRNGLNPKEVIALVFPELMRYNAIRDKIETFALESLYVQYGKDYANFSVGEFQIKPSFAERIEIDFLKIFINKELMTPFQIMTKDTIQSQEARLKRLKRIKDKNGMVHYLCLFWKIMNKKYPIWKSEEKKIKFFACAYNCGFEKPADKIELFLTKKLFHTGLSPILGTYSYADIAWNYFRQQP